MSVSQAPALTADAANAEGVRFPTKLPAYDDRWEDSEFGYRDPSQCDPATVPHTSNT